MALTDAQRALRRTGITATDIGAILGLDKYRTGWQVQKEKQGLEVFKGNLFSKAGEALEPVVAEQYCQDNAGVLLRKGITAQHPEHPLLIATPDYVVEDIAVPHVTRKALEIKSVFSHSTANEDWGIEESDQIPHKFYTQVNWQLGVLRVSSADVARFYAGEVRYWRVNFDASVFADMRDLGLLWWDKHMVRGVPCEPSAADLEAVRKTYPLAARPKKKEEPPEATAAEAELLATWRAAYVEKKKWEEVADAAEARVLEAIGTRLGLRTAAIKVKFGLSKGREATDWPALARELGATPDHVVRFTKRAPEFRRVWASFWNEKETDKA